MRHLPLVVLIALSMFVTQSAVGQRSDQTAPVPKAQVQAAEFTVPLPDGGGVFVRAKRPANATAVHGDRIVVMIHGATFAGTAFDVPLAGKSWMDYIAERGFDVYALDLPGYGRSTRPAAMEQPADQNAPLIHTKDAIAAVRAVVEHILRVRGAERVNLLGWSWGTTIAASFAADNPGRVERLVLYAPFWLRTAPSAAAPQRKFGAYRVVSREQALARWTMGVPDEKKKALIPTGWFDMWADATFATDPSGGGRTLRAPNGVVEDFQEYWFATPPKAYWEPTKIVSPVLLVVSEWDRESPPYMAQTAFPLLINAPWRRLTVLSEGTHFSLLERNRILLFRTVQQFLEEEAPTPEGVD